VEGKLFHWGFSQVTQQEFLLLTDRKARSRIGRLVVILCDRLGTVANWIACTGPRPFFWLNYYFRDLADERIIRGVARRGCDGDRVSIFVSTKTRGRLRVEGIQVGISPLVVHEAIRPDPFADEDDEEWTITHRPTGMSAIPLFFDNLWSRDAAIDLAHRIDAVVDDWAFITDKKIPKDVSRPWVAVIRQFFEAHDLTLDDDPEASDRDLS